MYTTVDNCGSGCLLTYFIWYINAQDWHQLWLRLLTYLLYLVYKCTGLPTTVAQVVYLLIVYRYTGLAPAVAQVAYYLLYLVYKCTRLALTGPRTRTRGSQVISASTPPRVTSAMQRSSVVHSTAVSTTRAAPLLAPVS